MANTPRKGRILESQPIESKGKPEPKRSVSSKGNLLGRKPIPENETKADKFIRLATIRVNNAIVPIRHLRNLANRSQYDFNDQQIRTMLDFIRAELDKTEATFQKATKDYNKFSF